jgi:Zn-dependent protease
MNKAIKLGKIRTSKTELIDILKAWIAISLAFTFVFTGVYVLSGRALTNLFTSYFLIVFLVSLFTAGLGFLLHELAHKFAAQHYGCVAEFRAWDQMLYLALGLALLVGFIFAAPGAVMISGMITRKENGIISAVGPLTNYILAAVFFGFGLAVTGGWLKVITSLGFQINVILGVFNLIPFGPLDGLKVFRWSPYIWGIMFIPGVLITFIFIF